MIISMVIGQLDKFTQSEVKHFMRSQPFRNLVQTMRTNYMQQILTLNPNEEVQELALQYKVLRNSLASWDEFEALIRQLDEEAERDHHH
jgi:hypothetical protein